ncbi:MAG: MBL fold metallo-hydrolase [Defluviitaleaceae bacterium]|nr:MBL fold metallo-hydrolase [Defluviitaleaceae bacterium]
MNIKVYGCRGSIAASHTQGSRYGGNTSCMLLESGGHSLIVDAGSGLVMLEKELREANPDYPGNLPMPPNILISHLHLDHIIGLSTFEPAWNKEPGMRVFTCSRDDRPLHEQVFGVFKPPYWPVTMPEVTACECIPIEANKAFTIGPFTVTPFNAKHPDETLSFHITDGHSSLVHLLDSEADHSDPASYKELRHYCNGADLVVFDAAYSPEDYPKYKGWGHSTVKDGVYLAKEWKCKRMLFAHFSQRYSDKELDRWKQYFSGDQFILAYDGIELVI